MSAANIYYKYVELMHSHNHKIHSTKNPKVLRENCNNLNVPLFDFRNFRYLQTCHVTTDTTKLAMVEFKSSLINYLICP